MKIIFNMTNYNCFGLSLLWAIVLSCSSANENPNEKRNSQWVECIEGAEIRFVKADEVNKFLFDDKFTGKIIGYYDSRKIKFINNYKNGLPRGESSKFYSNGEKRLQMIFHKNSMDGEFICTYDNGELCSTFRIINGLINDTSIVYSYHGDSLHRLYLRGENVELLEEYKLPTDFEYEKYMECMK